MGEEGGLLMVIHALEDAISLRKDARGNAGRRQENGVEEESGPWNRPRYRSLGRRHRLIRVPPRFSSMAEMKLPRTRFLSYIPHWAMGALSGEAV